MDSIHFRLGLTTRCNDLAVFGRVGKYPIHRPADDAHVGKISVRAENPARFL